MAALCSHSASSEAKKHGTSQVSARVIQHVSIEKLWSSWKIEIIMMVHGNFQFMDKQNFIIQFVPVAVRTNRNFLILLTVKLLMLPPWRHEIAPATTPCHERKMTWTWKPWNVLESLESSDIFRCSTTSNRT